MARRKDWIVAIERFIAALGYEGRGAAAQFASRLNASPSTVSLWLSGTKQPGAEMYVRMFKLGPSLPEAAPLLKLASDRSGSYAIEELQATYGKPKEALDEKRLLESLRGGAVPLLKNPTDTASGFDVPATVPLPEWLLSRSQLVAAACAIVPDDSMSPTLEQGYIVCIDTKQTDPARLNDHMVAVRDAQGINTMRWLRRSGENQILMPQNMSKRFHPVAFPDSGWSIIGKILWWVGTPH